MRRSDREFGTYWARSRYGVMRDIRRRARGRPRSRCRRHNSSGLREDRGSCSRSQLAREGSIGVGVGRLRIVGLAVLVAVPDPRLSRPGSASQRRACRLAITHQSSSRPARVTLWRDDEAGRCLVSRCCWPGRWSVAQMPPLRRCDPRSRLAVIYGPSEAFYIGGAMRKRLGALSLAIAAVALTVGVVSPAAGSPSDVAKHRTITCINTEALVSPSGKKRGQRPVGTEMCD
jgi:hypothetical protein